jgi:hypothetical protein
MIAAATGEPARERPQVRGDGRDLGWLTNTALGPPATYAVRAARASFSVADGRMTADALAGSGW